MLLKEISQNKKIKKPVIFGLSSTEILEEEKKFFKESGPIGFILFSRNIENKIKLKKLIKDLKELMEGEVLILIDQEGGRVQRMTEPNWKKYPNGQYFSDLYEVDKHLAKEEIFKNFQEIATDLQEVGINVNCAPVLDILSSQTHDIIGNRAYGNNPSKISDLAKEVCKGLLSKNIYPVIKHIPGHGRATADSHLELPKVSSSLEELRKSDFVAFKNLNDQKFAMTAHILYQAIDREKPATTSKKAIELIRNEIGFKNILMSDDLSMKALGGSFSKRTKESFEAGCDMVLHCNGKMEEMLEINNSSNLVNDNFFNKFIS